MTQQQEQLLVFHFDMNYVNLREDYIRKWLKQVADMGYNAILWEVEDKIQWETCSDCVWPEAMGKATFKDLLAYAKSLGLEAIPLLQTVGHGEYIMQHKEYAHLKEDPEYHDCYCTLNPDVRKFLKAMVSEYLELFGDIRHFHLGGDEAYVFGTCPECTAYAEKHGKNKLYADHILDIAEEIMAKGIRPGIWCDMILHYPEQVDMIPNNLVIWDWNYWSSDNSTETTRVWGKGMPDKKSIDQETLDAIPEIMDDKGDFVPFYTSDMLQRLGFDVILCSASRSSGDSVFCPMFDTHCHNIIGATRKTITANLLGTCVTSWAIRINNLETQELFLKLVPATFANPEKSAEDIIKEAADEMFGIGSAIMLSALSKLGQGFTFAQAQSTGIQWNKLKDSLPAPKNYINELIKTWKNDSHTWQDLKVQHSKTFQEIHEGTELLNNFMMQAQSGHDFLETWSKAAYHQLWQAQLGEQILCETQSAEFATLAKTLKQEAQHYFERMETPQSAAKNAGLIFDCLIEYFEVI